MTNTDSDIVLQQLIVFLPDGMHDEARQRILFAYNFAVSSHNNQIRETGESHIDHDLAVAQILAPLDVDVDTLIACLLHDILSPHTGITAEDIEEKFGPEVSSLVTGLNNLQDYAQHTQYTKQSNGDVDKSTLEVIRQAILSIIEGDIRIILIRLADCLQDLRNANLLNRISSFELLVKPCISTHH